MDYTIISTEQLEDTLITHVVFNLGGEQKEISISHFQPQSKEEVVANIENRMATEQAKLDAITKVALVEQAIKDEILN